MTLTTLVRAESGAPSTTLTPALSQRVFRAVLDALARPGQPAQLPSVPSLPPALLPLLALADLDTATCVLTAARDTGHLGTEPSRRAGLGTAGSAGAGLAGFGSVGADFAGARSAEVGLAGVGSEVVRDSSGWADVVTLATSAPPAPLDRARLVAALRPVNPDELRALPRGTALAPEDGALVTLAVAADPLGAATEPGCTDVRWLSGPGVEGRREVLLPLSAELLAARAQAVAGFPSGIDLLLVDPEGRLLGLPRTTMIEERG